MENDSEHEYEPLYETEYEVVSEIETETETETESETDSETESVIAESASRLALAWRWTIEALASFEKVTPSLLHDVIEKAVGLSEDDRKNAEEMVALKCLESLFGSLDYSGENGPPSQESKVVFDSSESCEEVLKLICTETPKSALRVAGPEMSKWDIKPFIAQKRASMRSSLHQLRDSILDGTHPYADFLLKKSGMKPINKRDGTSINNEGGIELSRRHGSSFSNPQGQKEKGKGSSLLQDERRISVVNPSSSSLLPSKRSAVEFTSEDEARQLPGCDDGYINAKKLKQHSAHNLNSGQDVDSSHETKVLEDAPERIVPQNERNDNDHLDENLVEDKLVKEEHFGSKKSGQCSATDESGIPCYIMPDRTQDGEMLEVISVEKVKDRSELPFEPKTSNNSPAEGNLHDIITDDHEPSSAEGNLHYIITDDPERGFRNDNHVNGMNTMSHIGFLSKTVATSADVGMNADEEEKNMLSDCDGYHDEKIDIAMKKKEFFGSQCMVGHDSYPLADKSELTVCVKCNEEGGQLLSCNASDCPLVVHDKCLSSSVGMNDEGEFCCPFCSYSLAISNYLEAKKHVALAKKKVATFIRTGFGHQSIVIKEVLQQQDLDPSRKAGVEDVSKICEDVDLENEDNRVTLDGGHVNEVVDHRAATDTDERLIELSTPLHIANSNHRENEASPMRVAPDVLSGEKDGNELVDQECQGNEVTELVDQEHQGNAVAELVGQECQGNKVAELVDQECQGKGKSEVELVNQECQGNVAEPEDGKKAVEQQGTLHKDQGPVEAVATQEGLHYQTDDNEEEPTYATNIEGEKSSSDDNDESIISRYSIRFRRKYLHSTSICPKTHRSRWKTALWTAEEEEILTEGVREFSSSVERSPKIPWRKILEFGSNVFRHGRTPRDLKDKWSNLCRSPKKD